MKTHAAKWASAVLVLLLTSALMSFRAARGGEGFEVFVNNQLVVQLFGKNMNGSSILYLDPATDPSISIKYHHCGQPGKNRRIEVHDEKGAVLKSWQFANSSAPASVLKVKMREVPGFDKLKGTQRWTIHYSSAELPQGRQLAIVAKGSQATARR